MAEFENSIAYGESLLANIRDRNDKLRKEEEKKARKNQWKALAGKVAISVAEDYMQQRTNNFINAENQVLRTIGAEEIIANNIKATEHEQNAKEYDGGVDAYYLHDFTDKVKNELVNKYTGTQYSQTQVDALAHLIAKDNYKDYMKSIQDDIALTKAFNADNISNDDYLANAKALAADRASIIRNLPGLKQLTNNVNADIIAANDKYRKGLVDLKNARKVSLEQRDGLIYNAVADYVEKHNIKTFGNPDTILELGEIKD